MHANIVHNLHLKNFVKYKYLFNAPMIHKPSTFFYNELSLKYPKCNSSSTENIAGVNSIVNFSFA